MESREVLCLTLVVQTKNRDCTRKTEAYNWLTFGESAMTLFQTRSSTNHNSGNHCLQGGRNSDFSLLLKHGVEAPVELLSSGSRLLWGKMNAGERTWWQL